MADAVKVSSTSRSRISIIVGISVAVVALIIGILVWITQRSPTSTPPHDRVPKSTHDVIYPTSSLEPPQHLASSSPARLSISPTAKKVYRPAATLGVDFISGEDHETLNPVKVVGDGNYSTYFLPNVNPDIISALEPFCPWFLHKVDHFVANDSVHPDIFKKYQTIDVCVNPIDRNSFYDFQSPHQLTSSYYEAGASAAVFLSQYAQPSNGHYILGTISSADRTFVASVPIPYRDRGVYNPTSSYMPGDMVRLDTPIKPAFNDIPSSTYYPAFYESYYYIMNGTGYPPVIANVSATNGVLPVPTGTPGHFVSPGLSYKVQPSWIAVNAPCEAKVLTIDANNNLNVSNTLGVKVGDSAVIVYDNTIGAPSANCNLPLCVQMYVLSVIPGQVSLTYVPPQAIESICPDGFTGTYDVTTGTYQPGDAKITVTATAAGVTLSGVYIVFGAPLYQFNVAPGQFAGPWDANNNRAASFYKEGDIVMYHDYGIRSKQCYMLQSEPASDPTWVSIANQEDFYVTDRNDTGVFTVSNDLLRIYADEFDPKVTYNPGDVVSYKNYNYRCIRTSTKTKSLNSPYYAGEYPEFVMVYGMKLGIQINVDSTITEIDLSELRPEPFISYIPDNPMSITPGDYAAKGGVKPYQPAIVIQNLTPNYIRVDLGGAGNLIHTAIDPHTRKMFWPSSHYTPGHRTLFYHHDLHAGEKDSSLHFPNCGKKAFSEINGHKYEKITVAMYCGLQEVEALNEELLSRFNDIKDVRPSIWRNIFGTLGDNGNGRSTA